MVTALEIFERLREWYFKAQVPGIFEAILHKFMRGTMADKYLHSGLVNELPLLLEILLHLR